MSIPLIISLNLGKLLAKLGGTALPGFVALKLTPDSIARLRAKKKLRSIVITGTNGKTTTARLIGSVLSQAGIGYIHNRSGSNLLQGIATSLLTQTGQFGVWEVDEAAMPRALKELKPEIVIITNLSRDQLDRYGELDTLLNKWQAGFAALPDRAKILVNRADRRLQALTDRRIISYGNDLPGQGLAYPAKYRGKFNYDTIWAAEAVCRALGLNPGLAGAAALVSPPAFGRGEVFKINDSSYQINLVKNPASFKAVWQMFLGRGHLNRPLLLILNDNFADGTDVSWIWDVPFSHLPRRRAPVVVSGRRAFDLALRLKYAGLKPQLIKIRPAIGRAVQTLAQISGSPKYIFPTYTAMLELRRNLNRTPWN